MSITFEGYDKRINKINAALKANGIKDLEDARKICLDKGIDVEKIVKSTQMIAFENATWAYTVGCAIAIKKGCKKATGNENENCMLLSNTARSLALPMLLCSEEEVEGNHSCSARKNRR